MHFALLPNLDRGLQYVIASMIMMIVERSRMRMMRMTGGPFVAHNRDTTD